MNVGDIVGAALNGFERLLRWIYPGLLFWLTLPIVIAPISTYIGCSGCAQSASSRSFAIFYSTLPVYGHIAFVITAGFVIYLVERYLIHEGLLMALWFFRFKKIGIAATFGYDKKWVRIKNYRQANAAVIWLRFGKRPEDSSKSGERAENRFDNYVANRMAAVHALGSTWLVGIIIWFIGFFAGERMFFSWPWWTHLFYSLGILVMIILWGWHAEIMARAEQSHYNLKGHSGWRFWQK